MTLSSTIFSKSLLQHRDPTTPQSQLLPKTKSLQITRTPLTSLPIISSPPYNYYQEQKRHRLKNSNTRSHDDNDDKLAFLPPSCKSMLNSIVDEPLSSLNAFFDTVKFELTQLDFASLLKGMDVSGNWEKPLFLFEWLVLNNAHNTTKLGNQAIEMMAWILGRESQHLIASRLFDEIPIKDYSLDVRAYTTILNAYSQSGKYESAVSLFEQINENGPSPTLVTYNVMLAVYGKMGRSWNKILGLLDVTKKRGFEFDNFTCSSVFTACGRDGLLEEAKNFFADLKSQGYVPGMCAYNSLLELFAKSGIYSEALAVLKEMEESDCPPDLETYNQLVAVYVTAGFHEEGTALIGTMISTGVLPNVVTYVNLIRAYGKVGKVDKALSLFNPMKESGCVPHVHTFNAILGMLAKTSRYEKMMEILREMESYGCAPDRATWNTMLCMFRDRGMRKHAHRIFQEMKNCGIEPDFHTLMQAFGRCGLGSDAAKVHDGMMKSGYTPCVRTYNALLDALAHQGDWKLAESVILDMRKKGF
ncbi:hypothetical protein C3L33_14295, partial [Rhododendron williamsianum]